ncbi:intraflagellar transport-associated protein isoform X2 [Polypterus senegalus]|uniref:intraflagellar transport-associated protein isoform X2 n=1 Tax=Polypterus senegalus TaxID=55291 RepID=UPI0019653FB1|nr:intraflagellar transport-associated protein isoform X2 [Polypterus senegalus]
MPLNANCFKIMDHETIIQEALDLFCNSPEQTYEEFLNSFTYLSIGKDLKDRGAIEIMSDDKMKGRAEGSLVTISSAHEVSESQPDCDEFLLDSGVHTGCLSNGDLIMAENVKVDNYVDPDDGGSDDGDDFVLQAGHMLLPGEVEGERQPYLPSFVHHTQLEICTLDSEHKQAASSTEVSYVCRPNPPLLNSHRKHICTVQYTRKCF